MRKRYIFLMVSLISIILITYFMKSDYDNKFIDEVREEITVMHTERDSVFLIAEEVINDVSERKKNDSMRLGELDYLVKDNQTTIEQQNRELNKMVLKSNELKKLAEEEKEKALEMKELSELQKIKAEKAKIESLRVFNELNEKYILLKKENIEYQKKIGLLEEELLKVNSLIDSLSKTKNIFNRGKN